MTVLWFGKEKEETKVIKTRVWSDNTLGKALALDAIGPTLPLAPNIIPLAISGVITKYRAMNKL